MTTVLIILVVVILLVWLFFKNGQQDGSYNQSTGNYNNRDKNKKSAPQSKQDTFSKKKKSWPFRRLFEFTPSLPFDDQSISWCASFLTVEEKELRQILRDFPQHYQHFKMRKRSGGYRTIDAPNQTLIAIQSIIYKRILLPVNIHPAATGFRQERSIVDNATPHLGKGYILKTDISDFFGSIKQYMVVRTFEKIGYPKNIAEVLAFLCCYDKKLPQGAPTSPALSNIVAYTMDQKLTVLATKYNLTYTRYADDLTFSGNALDKETILSQIREILLSEKFVIKNIKTKYLEPKKRKIITGISVSSGTKLTIPKATKREIRKNVHYVIMRGLESHLKYIKSNDPSYLKRLIGQMSFWLSVEPESQFVIKNLPILRQMEKRSTNKL